MRWCIANAASGKDEYIETANDNPSDDEIGLKIREAGIKIKDSAKCVILERLDWDLHVVEITDYAHEIFEDDSCE